MSDILEGVDVLNPTKKQINFNGEIVEIAFIPTRISLEALKANDDIRKGLLTEYEGFEKIIDLTLKVCKSNPNITKDWLYDNTSIEMLMNFFEVAGNGGKTKASEGEPAKN
jgi:hypothetical protein